MEKNEASVRAIAASVIALEDPESKLDVDLLVQTYLKGEPLSSEDDGEQDVILVIEEILWLQFGRYQPSSKQDWEDNAPRIPVKIAGKEYQTFLDERGVQRFCGNSVIKRIMSSPTVSNSHGELSLNTLVVDYQNGMFSSEDWLDFMTSFGYSVSGLLGWTEFQHLPVENPLWQD